MPAAGVALLASWAGGAIATGIFGLAAGSLGAAIVGGVIAMGLSRVGNSLLGNDTGSTGSSVTNSGILVNAANTVTSIPVVYGTRRVGAKRVYVGNSGDSNKYLHMVMALSEGEIYGIGNIYFNNVPVASGGGIATQTSVSGTTVTPGTAGTTYIADGAKVTAFYDKIVDPQDPTTLKDNPYGSNTDIYVHYGTDAQTVDTHLQGDVGATTWTNNHRLRGVSYIYVRLAYDRNVFGSAPDITVDVVGKKVQEYTTTTAHTTAAATNGHYNNPAWVLLDYLTNARYGRGIDIADVDIQSFIDAAAYCNSSQTLNVNGTATTLAQRYIVAGACDPDNTLFVNIKNLLATMNGFLVFTGGQYRLLIDKPVASADIGFEFDESNIIGGMTVSLGSKTTRYNRVKINYFDPNRDWNPNVYILDDTSYRVNEDLSQVLQKEIELPMVSDYNRVHYIGRMFMNQSRYGTVVEFTAAPSALVCNVGDVVYITHPTPAYNQVKFRIMNMKLKYDGTVQITAAQYADDVYTNLGTIPFQQVRRSWGGFSGKFFAPIATPVNPPQAPLTVTNTPLNGAPAMTVTYGASTDPRLKQYVIVYTGGGQTQEYTTTGTTAIITGVKSGTTYTVLVFAENLDGRRSAALIG